MTGIFSGYVSSMLAEYAKNPGVNWKHKDAAIYLVTSLASKAQTQKVRCCRWCFDQVGFSERSTDIEFFFYYQLFACLYAIELVIFLFLTTALH